MGYNEDLMWIYARVLQFTGLTDKELEFDEDYLNDIRATMEQYAEECGAGYYAGYDPLTDQNDEEDDNE